MVIVLRPNHVSDAIPSEVCISKSKSSSEPDEMMAFDKYLENPFPQFEHVGVDEENQYLVDKHVPNSGDDNATDEDYEPGEEEDDDVEESIEEIADDEEWVAKDAEPDIAPVVAYDMDDPPMTVGTVYPSIKMLRLAMAQYAIKREFEYDIEKSEPTRFRANCVVKGCRWRIHASTLEDDVTFEVIVLL